MHASALCLKQVNRILLQEAEKNLNENLDRCEHAARDLTEWDLEALEKIEQECRPRFRDAFKALHDYHEENEVWFNAPVKLSVEDVPPPWHQSLTKRRLRVGILCCTMNPLHYQHLYLALRAIPFFRLDTMVIQGYGQGPYKPFKAAAVHRHQMGRMAIEPFFPLLRYTSIGKDNYHLGEANVMGLVMQNWESDIPFLGMNPETLKNFSAVELAQRLGGRWPVPIDWVFVVAGDNVEVAARLLRGCTTFVEALRNYFVRAGLKPDELPRLSGGSFVDGENVPFDNNDGIFIEKKKADFGKINIRSTAIRENPARPWLPWNAYLYMHQHHLYYNTPNIKP